MITSLVLYAFFSPFSQNRGWLVGAEMVLPEATLVMEHYCRERLRKGGR